VAEDLDLIRGTLDLLILSTLSWAPMHGLAVVRWIEQTSGRRFQIEEGALYPALHRLEQKQLLQSEWGYTEQGRRARIYKLTTAGRKHLASETSRWARYTEAVGLVLAGQPTR
jgi:PadR family transcriptional regulator